MVSPPQPGDESYNFYVRELNSVYTELKLKAEILGKSINEIKGMSVTIPDGAMYAFVKFELPPEPNVDLRTMSAGQKREYEAKRDTEYCLALLEETGICVVPGSGFGQAAGTLHFRTTFLPPRDEIEEVVVKLKYFHEMYCEKAAHLEERVV